jgi:hypothetical protein
MKHLHYILLFSLLSLAGISKAQISMPRPSPEAKVSQKIALAEATVIYCRPQAKGRKVFGELVPFDKMWRTGANAPTKLIISDSLTIQGKKIAKGEYGLYAMPGQSEWTIVIGNDASMYAWDIKENNEVHKFKVKSESIANHVEAFTIGFVNVSPNSAELEITWEKTSVKFKIEQDADAKVMADIKAKTEVDANTLYQAASYYFDTNRDLNQALKWISNSTDRNPQFWTLHLKAKIQQKLGDYKGAILTAQRSSEMAKNAKNDEYVKFNAKIISEATEASAKQKKK